MKARLTARIGESGKVTVDAPRHIHLVAVGGVGMGALAGMLKERGFEVSGSDEAIYPPMSHVLERLGIRAQSGYGPANLEPRPDLVVIGNKVSRGNPEVQAVLAMGIPYLSFPETLAELFLASHRSLVIVGTHGKTTCTTMLACVLEQAGRDPSLMVGGETRDFGGNFKLGRGEFFVVEGDEYDSAFFDKGPKFLHYRPDGALLTAVEFDHADIYADLAAVKTAFGHFVELLPESAPLVVAAEFPHALEVAARSSRANLVTFGADPHGDWTLVDFRDHGGEVRFVVHHDGRPEGEVTLRVPGMFNARNALGVYVLARAIGLTHDEVTPGLASYSGVARRQELVGEFDGVVLIDDFAHHPTAVRETLAAVRARYGDRRLWALFEPRSNTSRRRVFQKDYALALAAADRVVVAGVFQKASDSLDSSALFSPEQLVADLRANGEVAWAIDDSEEIAALLADSVRPGDVVIMMSNGDFGGLRQRLVSTLGRRRDAEDA